jgi:hypothetical protein
MKTMSSPYSPKSNSISCQHPTLTQTTKKKKPNPITLCPKYPQLLSRIALLAIKKFKENEKQNDQKPQPANGNCL